MPNGKRGGRGDGEMKQAKLVYAVCEREPVEVGVDGWVVRFWADRFLIL
jgi:hypothetical protein